MIAESGIVFFFIPSGNSQPNNISVVEKDYSAESCITQQSSKMLFLFKEGLTIKELLTVEPVGACRICSVKMKFLKIEKKSRFC